MVSEQRSLLQPLSIIWIDSRVLSSSKVDQSIIDIMRPTKSLHLTLNTVQKSILVDWMLVVSQELLKRVSRARNGHLFSSKLWTLKAPHHHGTLILPIYTRTQSCINQMLRSGASIMDFGPDKHWLYSLLIHDGCIFRQIRYHSITYSQDLRDNSQEISTHTRIH